MGQRSNWCLRFLPDPCENFRCKRGKTCKLDADNKPGCVCQEPSECPPSVNEFDYVSMLMPIKEMSHLHIVIHLCSYVLCDALWL